MVQKFEVLIAIVLLLFAVETSSSFEVCCGEFEGREGTSGAISDLVECVRNAAESGYQKSLESAVPFVSPQRHPGPTLAVALLSRATDNIYSYAAYSLFIQATYAQHNGYMYLPGAFYAADGDKKNDDYRYHRKLSPIIEALSAPMEMKVKGTQKKVMTGGEAYFSDYLVWMDADAVPLNMSLRFEQLAAAHPKAHILASKDSSSMINTGVMIIRNSDWALQFLRDWRDMKDGLHRGDSSHPPAHTDQAGFAAAFSVYESKERTGEIAPSWRDKIAILEAHELNSVLPAFSRQEPSHNILHLAAESDAYRAQVMQAGAATLCSARKRASAEQIYIGGKRAGWPLLLGGGFEAASYSQLGLSRARLMEAALLVYGRDAGRSLQELRSTLALDGDELEHGQCSREIKMSVGALKVDLGSLRSAVGKYCHALLHASSSSADEQRGVSESRSLQIRQVAYRLVAEWVGILQKMIDMQAEYLSKRERSGVSSSSRGSGLEGDKDGDPKAFFTHRLTHAADQHPPMARMLPRELQEELGVSSAGGEELEGVASLQERCAAAGRAPTVLVRGYLGCARLKSFENPQEPVTQHSYCVASKTDVVLEGISENMKLSAELAFDYLVALASASHEQVRALSTPSSSSAASSPDATMRQEKEEVASYLTALLSSLLVSVHSSQRIIVADMSAGLLLQLADMTLLDMQRTRTLFSAWRTAEGDAVSTTTTREDEARGKELEEQYLWMRRKGVGYLEEALDLYVGMQDGQYSSETDSEGKTRPRGTRVHALLSPSLSSHGVDLRAVTSAASGLGALYCEDGRHSEGLTLHYRALELEAYYQGYRAGPTQPVSEGSLLLIPHLYNVAACKRAEPHRSDTSAGDSERADSISPLSLELPIDAWRLHDRTAKEALSLMMALYSAGFQSGVQGLERYQSLAESGASLLATQE